MLQTNGLSANISLMLKTDLKHLIQAKKKNPSELKNLN